MPGYLHLCIETWKKFLPEYHVEILDYNNLKYYLGEPLFSSIVCKEMKKSIQADGIRVAMLKKYGGIWMDPDTIVIGREFLDDLKNTELAMFGDEMNKTQHIGFIYASNNSFLLNEWFGQIKLKVNDYKDLLSKKHNKNDANWINSFNKVYSWNMLGNRIIDPLLKNITDKKYYSRLDKYKMNVFPEDKHFENIFFDNTKRYREFYFKKGDIEYIINKVKKGIILLHNSWTPKRYKKMTAQRFIRKDIRMAKLLAKLVNNITL
jgi:mannosyltransferase OCH1-like enzyme